jgi:hypothetical protein
MGKGGDEAEPTPRLSDLHISRRSPCLVRDVLKRETLFEPHAHERQWQVRTGVSPKLRGLLASAAIADAANNEPAALSRARLDNDNLWMLPTKHPPHDTNLYPAITVPEMLTLNQSAIASTACRVSQDLKNIYMQHGACVYQRPTGLTGDDVLDNITLFWLTNTGMSAARLYWENKLPFFDAANVSIPAAVSVFPDELYQPPRGWAERAYPKLIHYNKLDKGGTSRRGNSRNSSWKSCARGSDRSANQPENLRRASSTPAPASLIRDFS